MRLDPIHQRPDADLIFKKEDVPNLEFFNEYAEIHGPGDITGETMHRVVATFCAIAKSGNSTWKPKLEMDYSIDNYTLHHSAIPLMMATASSLSYQPSTLTLMRLFLILNQQRKVRNPRFAKIALSTEAQFKQLARTETNPDILTIQGLLAKRDGRDDAALRFFTEAINMGERNAGNPPRPTGFLMDLVSPDRLSDDSERDNPRLREPRWHFEVVCRQMRALLLLKKGDDAAALESFVINAVELDSPDAYVGLAKLDPLKSAEANRFWLTKAAQTGHPEATRLLVKEYLMQLEEAEKSPSPQAKKDAPEIRLIWGWVKIAGKVAVQELSDDRDLTKDLLAIEQAVLKGRASMRLEGVNKDGSLKVATWIYEGQAEPRKIELTI
ncbi:hypothetical protein QBC44DRAFT_239723 [Cladorrhinum sp. PSN332]|nr:hypothetical protein QBC44DRAFT_239723 [Cladorrhinum sp. PSN332]